MIDAYEIGIQLLLQEDVSAGLAVINHGLAEVDRAIAATNANLVGLVREAETTTKAVAAAVSGRATPVAATEQGVSGATEQVVRAQPGEVAASQPATISGEKAAAPQTKAAEASGPVVRPTSSPQSDEKVLPNQDKREQVILPSAPFKSDVSGGVKIDQPATNTQAQLEQPLPVAPAQVAFTVPQTREHTPSTLREVAAAGQEPRRSATHPSTQVAITAAVSRAQRPEIPEMRPEQTRSKLLAGSANQRERAAAPSSGLDHFGAQVETTRLHEKAAAPKTASQERDDSGGGTVMLDGRLVGQWLSDHMAREASRPPAGTNFFDPRQTPAWNVSGAI